MPKRTPTYEELMAREDTQFIAELGGNLYVKLPPREHYDNTIWKVDKNTHEVSYMMFTAFLGISNRATYVLGSLWGD